MEDIQRDRHRAHQSAPRYQVRLPGFIVDNDIGLGDVVKRATAAVGIRPCGGCARRAERLNRWAGFTNRPSAR